jgi:hypothetical protein
VLRRDFTKDWINIICSFDDSSALLFGFCVRISGMGKRVMSIMVLFLGVGGLSSASSLLLLHIVELEEDR